VIGINKSLEALLRGYILFDVNHKKFWLYNAALDKRKQLSKNGDAILFKGFNILKMKWLNFFICIKYV
jgi:hypothetical protein